MPIQLSDAKKLIEGILNKREMLLVTGECFVRYQGRAGSKLPKGKRMLMVKADKSFAIHQNRFLRPVNYMMNAVVSTKLKENVLVIEALKRKPKELIEVFFYSVDFVKGLEIEGEKDLSLFGSEKELSDQLMQDLSLIEPGLKPLKQESPLRKGVIDILAEDSEGSIVVVEVKRRRADLNAVSQLQRYMKQVEKIKGKKTRGILCAPSIGKHSMELLERSDLEFYKLDYEISNPKAEIKGLQKKQKGIKDFIEGKQ
ncbi:MAG: endonuclease NucS [archaeon]